MKQGPVSNYGLTIQYFLSFSKTTRHKNAVCDVTESLKKPSVPKTQNLRLLQSTIFVDLLLLIIFVWLLIFLYSEQLAVQVAMDELFVQQQ